MCGNFSSSFVRKSRNVWTKITHELILLGTIDMTRTIIRTPQGGNESTRRHFVKTGFRKNNASQYVSSLYLAYVGGVFDGMRLWIGLGM